MFDDAADWWCDLLMCCCSVFHTYTICDLLTHMQATEYRIQIHSPIHSTHFGFFTAHFDGRFSFSCVAHRQTTNVRRWWRSVNFMPQRAKKENVFDLQRVTWNRRTEIWRIEHHLSPVSTVLCWLCLGSMPRMFHLWRWRLWWNRWVCANSVRRVFVRLCVSACCRISLQIFFAWNL